SDPSIFLVPEILHTCHKFFFNHVLMWCKAVVGVEELDLRFQALPICAGYHHLTHGICHVKQMTGQEHCEIQGTVVAAIVGALPPGFWCTVCAMVDFIY
ncbi:hypothetical protein FIBSPDRAFT_741086, partial [Athelia psychrophila]